MYKKLHIITSLTNLTSLINLSIYVHDLGHYSDLDSPVVLLLTEPENPLHVFVLCGFILLMFSS